MNNNFNNFKSINFFNYDVDKSDLDFTIFKENYKKDDLLIFNEENIKKERLNNEKLNS